MTVLFEELSEKQKSSAGARSGVSGLSCACFTFPIEDSDRGQTKWSAGIHTGDTVRFSYCPIGLPTGHMT